MAALRRSRLRAVHSTEQREVRIAVETDRYRIVGNVVLPREGYRSRLTDFLNGGEREFMAVTDVEMESLDRPGQPIRTDFIALSRRHVVVAMELEATHTGP
ncbi:MAG: hypothetical protein QOK31_615 [Solirubrobacteraceae bacterium]|nr:hypothetical protein [Solirubrobacteraceae bacterium]